MEHNFVSKHIIFSNLRLLLLLIPSQFGCTLVNPICSNMMRTKLVLLKYCARSRVTVFPKYFSNVQQNTFCLLTAVLLVLIGFKCFCTHSVGEEIATKTRLGIFFLFSILLHHLCESTVLLSPVLCCQAVAADDCPSQARMHHVVSGVVFCLMHSIPPSSF